MLDIDESVAEIITWIEENGGFEKNALYVTADHDHYLTLVDGFPEALANFLVEGQSHLITPENNRYVQERTLKFTFSSLLFTVSVFLRLTSSSLLQS